MYNYKTDFIQFSLMDTVSLREFKNIILGLKKRNCKRMKAKSKNKQLQNSQLFGKMRLIFYFNYFYFCTKSDITTAQLLICCKSCNRVNIPEN